MRNQQYMLDDINQLFDLTLDPGQTKVIDKPSDSLLSEFVSVKKEWINTTLGELVRNRKEVFPVGFEGSRYTQLPARDARSSGKIVRSNRWPNSSFFTNWKNETDSITRDCDILAEGNFKVQFIIPVKSLQLVLCYY